MTPGDSPNPREQRLALIAVLLLVVVWAANFTVQKEVYDAITPAGFLFARYLLMPAFAVALLWHRYGWQWPRLPRADAWALVRLGLAGHTLHIGMATYGVHWSTAFSSAVILACGPVFTLLILRWYGTERLSRAQIGGVAVASAGVLVFLSEKLVSERWQASGGDLLLLVAAALFAYYTVAAKPLIQRHGGVTVMSYGVLVGSGPLVLLTLPAAWSVPWATVPPSIWIAMLWAVLVSAFLGWLVWGWVNAVRGVARTAPLMYLTPPLAGVIAWIFMDERYTLVKIVGAAITLLGVALAQFAARGRRN